jgi:hypothetical protein
MTIHVQKKGDVNLTSLIIRDRYMPPNETAIKRMMADLKINGQIAPILVRLVTGSDRRSAINRLVVGACRFEAAKRLGWKTLRAEFITADHELDYAITELAENLIRRDLTRQQKREMKAKMIAYQKQIMTDIEPAKGGRGNKGGVSEAARNAGVPRTTARRRRKPGHNTQNGQVSAELEMPFAAVGGDVPDPGPEIQSSNHRNGAYSRLELKMVPVRMTVAELERLEKYWQLHKYRNRSECVRELVREACKDIDA